MDPRELPGRLEQAEGLDGPVDLVAAVVKRAIPPGSATKDALSGKWLGHALHPLLTDLPIGFWTSAWVLDIVGGRPARRASQRLIGLGVLSTVPTAAAGLADWSDLSVEERRLGLVHAAANSAALTCYTASWLARRRGHHWRGVAWGMAGATAATVGGYLGGALVFR